MRHDQPRSAYLRLRSVALVFLGGSLGVLAREVLMLLSPAGGGAHVAVLFANLLGALLLGLLLESSTKPGPDVGQRQSVRLLLGTGVLGGFTTYSALAQVVLVFIVDGDVWMGVGYGAATLLLGGIATWVGVWLGGLIVPARGRRPNRKRGARG